MLREFCGICLKTNFLHLIYHFKVPYFICNLSCYFLFCLETLSYYNFYFSKTGGAKGKGEGVTGIDDMKYIYMFDCKVKADTDDKYQLVKVSNIEEGNKSTDINALILINF